jgi:hypothetical protein
MTLEECDEAFIKGVFLIKDAVLNYAQHKLTAKEIHARVRSLGATEGASTIRRWVAGFRAEKLLPEKEISKRTERHHRQMERQNAQNEQIAAPVPTSIPVEAIPIQRDGKPEPSSLFEYLAENHEVELPSKVVDLMDEDGLVMPDAVEALPNDEVSDIIENLAWMANRERGNAVSYLATSELLLKRYGSTAPSGEWKEHAPTKILKNLIPDLTDDQLQDLRSLITEELNSRSGRADLSHISFVDI